MESVVFFGYNLTLPRLSGRCGKNTRNVKEELFHESIQPLAGHDDPASEPPSRKNHVVSFPQ